MKKWVLTTLIFLFLLGFVSPLWAQSGSSVQYVYDGLGRLTQVIDPTGTTATYNYDAVGNLLSITRSSTSPSSLAIFSFSPAQGNAGQTVTIQGQNFSTTPSSNTVKFNGTASTVTAATANSLTTTVPAGATTGPISVTVGTSTATSSSNFTVLAVPVITSISPSTPQLNTGSINPFTVNGSNLTGATFSFLPIFATPPITVSNVNINGNGTSATMTLTLASNALGSFTVIAANGTGSSSSVPTASNTLTIVSSDPSADFDGDGLTNIYEAAIATGFGMTGKRRLDGTELDLGRLAVALFVGFWAGGGALFLDDRDVYLPQPLRNGPQFLGQEFLDSSGRSCATDSHVAKIHVEDFLSEEVEILAWDGNPIGVLVGVLSFLFGPQVRCSVKPLRLVQNHAGEIPFLEKVLRNDTLVEHVVGTENVGSHHGVRKNLLTEQRMPVRNVGR